MAELATYSQTWFKGQPCRELRLPNGDSLQVALQGAQVLSWVSGGRERLYLSPRNLFDGNTAIRGGIPVCFPQFNQRGPLPKHGFARNLLWRVDEAPVLAAQEAQLSLQLTANDGTKAVWPHSFEVALTLCLQPGELTVNLMVRNRGAEPLSFTGALHTYLAVRDVATVQLHGLEGQPEWDAVTDRHGVAADRLRFDAEFDRVYAAAHEALTLQAPEGCLHIAQSPSLANTVVWNPGAAKGALLTDMPPLGYQEMLCVEAAQVMHPIEVEAGGAWQGWQRLSVL